MTDEKKPKIDYVKQLAEIKAKEEAMQKQLAEMKEKRRIAAVGARKQSKEQQKKDDGRRKILWGAMFIEWMKDNQKLKDAAEERLDKFLTRETDRVFMGLSSSSLPVDQTSAGQAQEGPETSQTVG